VSGGTGDTSFVVVGAGLAGTLMSVYLGQAGYEVELYERRPDPRAAGAHGGRSINLALSARAIHALSQVGLADAILSNAVPMRGRMMHAGDGQLTFQPYGTRPEHVINSVSRGGLNMALVDAAERLPSVSVHFSRGLTELDLETRSLVFGDGDSGKEVHVAARGPVIGADGAFSAVRGQFQRLDRFNYRQDYLDYGYKELTIPPATGGGFRMEPNALHIWPRGGYMMIALPNRDGSFTCTLFWPFDGPDGFAALADGQDVLAHFQRRFPDAVDLMPTLAEDYAGNPTSSLVTIRSGPWSHGGSFALLGDACHAVVPFYGQGANAAFEDCTVLAECIAEGGPDWPRVFQRYFEVRKRHVDALADLALQNFVEMRDHVGSKRFLMKKKTEKALHRLFPRWYVPLYTMVSFTRIPYHDAVLRAAAQDRAVRRALWVVSAAVLVGIVLLWN